ncbi:MAG: phosphopantetheine-binding protein [Cypionkella sp.]|nr:phosphopantetheine-binding protein [Cypionkella sp.]
MNQMTDIAANQNAAEAKIIAIIAQQAMMDASQITPQTALADLALDSLVMVEIVFALEETFGVTIPFNANSAHHAAAGFDMSTPAAIAAAVQALPRA